MVDSVHKLSGLQMTLKTRLIIKHSQAKDRGWGKLLNMKRDCLIQ